MTWNKYEKIRSNALNKLKGITFVGNIKDQYKNMDNIAKQVKIVNDFYKEVNQLTNDLKNYMIKHKLQEDKELLNIFEKFIKVQELLQQK